MSVEIDSKKAEQVSREVIKEFCNQSVITMCRFYGAGGAVFEDKLNKGYSKISFGRSPYGFIDETSSCYFSAFAAFSKKDSVEIVVLEVKKETGFPGEYSSGLKEKKYSQKQYERTKKRFKLILFEEDLNSFIQTFPWPSKSEPIN